MSKSKSKSKSQQAFDKLFDPVNAKYGAPMGYNNHTLPNPGRLYDRIVPLSVCGAYDKAGRYFGIGDTLRVEYNADLTHVQFYRE